MLATAETTTSSLLWEVCRPEPSIAAIRLAADGNIDPARTASAAIDHGVGPLLWRALGLADRQSRLDEWGETVQAEAELLRCQATLLLPLAVAAAIGPLADAGLEPLVFKGPALSTRYPAPGLRPMGDIDLILPATDHAKAVATLGTSGWTVVQRPGRLHYDTFLVHPEVPGLAVELHHELNAWNDRPNGLRAADLWDRRVRIDCLGTPAFGLPVEDELVALAAHAGKPYHCFSRLIWIADLAVVVAHAVAAGGVDWDLVRYRTRGARCQTVVAVGLVQAGRLGVEAPSDLTEVKGSGTRRAALAPLFRPEWPLTRLDEGIRNRLRYALTDDTWRRVLLLVGAPAADPVWTWPGSLVDLGSRALRRWWRLRRQPPM
jgi:hypothetical protein